MNLRSPKPGIAMHLLPTKLHLQVIRIESRDALTCQDGRPGTYDEEDDIRFPSPAAGIVAPVELCGNGLKRQGQRRDLRANRTTCAAHATAIDCLGA